MEGFRVKTKNRTREPFSQVPDEALGGVAEGMAQASTKASLVVAQCVCLARRDRSRDYDVIG